MKFVTPFLLIWTTALTANSQEREPFQNPPNNQQETIPLLSPKESLARLTLPEGFVATMFAAEPQVRQPIGLTTDHRGRLWVAENYTYSDRTENYDMSLSDRVVILEDKDGDGSAETRKIFWDKGKKLTSVELGFGGVWVLCAPQLLFIPDRDQNDVPDGPAQVILDGWNDHSIRHNIVNGLRWGPDGWLYGRHGIQATSYVGKPGASPSQRTALNCSIWRYHPVRGVFEVVATGTTNPWGFDYDELGQMFFSNTVIGHLWHVIPGARFRRMYGSDLRPHTYSLIEQTADHFHWDTSEAWNDIRRGLSDTSSKAGGGHAHVGLMIYLGDNWPAEYRGSLFIGNLHGLRINHDKTFRSGCSYTAQHQPDFLHSSDPYFRSIEMIYGPDGAVYLADWSDIGECHENDGVHRTSGRIFKISHGRLPRGNPVDLAKLNNVQLADLQLHDNDWFARRSRRLLQERSRRGDDLADARRTLLRHFDHQPETVHKLRSLWALFITGGIDSDWLLEQLDHEDEHIRAWAVRLLSDRPIESSDVIQSLARLASSESSGLVRSFLASALHRLPLDSRWPLATALATHGEDATDRVQPLMVWYGIEPSVALQPDAAIKLATSSGIPLLRRHIARRLASELKPNPAATELLVAALRDTAPPTTKDILTGIAQALEGMRKAKPPESWKEITRDLTGDEELRGLVRKLNVVFGDGKAIAELRQLVEKSPDSAVRRQALRTLVNQHPPGLDRDLVRWLNDRILATEAVRGLSFYDRPDTPSLLLDRFSRLEPQGQREAIATLSSRASFAKALLTAIGSNKIDRQHLTAYHARQIRSMADEELRQTLDKVWGSMRETSGEKRGEMARITKLLTRSSDAADLGSGRGLFAKHCASCHKLYGEGEAIGPDLTGANRQNLDYLLENIIDPSASMVSDFKVSVISFRDGRVVTGVIVEQTDQTLTVQTQKEKLRADREDVEQIVPQNISLMPEGLLDNLSDDEIRDLLGYVSGLPTFASSN